jgi:hypothetical protein
MSAISMMTHALTSAATTATRVGQDVGAAAFLGGDARYVLEAGQRTIVDSSAQELAGARSLLDDALGQLGVHLLNEPAGSHVVKIVAQAKASLAGVQRELAQVGTTREQPVQLALSRAGSHLENLATTARLATS